VPDVCPLKGCRQRVCTFRWYFFNAFTM